VTSGQKTAVSLLTTVVIFACFTVAAFAGLFSVIEARFYEPAKVAGIRKQLDTVSASGETYIKTLLDRFGTGSASYINNKAVVSYLSQVPADPDVQQRTKVTGMLFTETPGLDGIRLVDLNGRNVHFSTYPSDILKQSDTLRMYKNYEELRAPSGEAEFAFDSVSAPDSRTNSTGKYHILYDGKNSRLIFSFPFYDSYSAYRGTMLFYVNAQDFNRTLIMQNLVPLSDTCVLVSSPDGSSGGFVFGMPNVGRDVIEPRILSKWQSTSTGPDKIVSVSQNGTGTSDSDWVLISGSRNLFMRISGVYRMSAFMMPQTVQILLLVCVFVTLFLIIFMIFSLRHDDMVVIRDRIKRLQFALVNEYLENKENVDWNDVSRKIADRRQDVSNEIKKSLGSRAKKHEEETDALITRSWDEIINALNSRSGNVLAAPGHTAQQNSFSEQQEIRRMLEEILQNGSIKVQAVAAPSPERAAVPPVKTEPAGEAEGAEEVEPLEEVPEAELAGEAEDIEEVEPLEEVPDAETVGEVEPVEEIPEAEPAGEAEDAEEVELLEEVPDAETVGEVEPVEEIPEAKPAGEAEDAEEVELLEEVPGAKTAGDVEPVEEAKDTESVAVDEFINSENENNAVPAAGEIMTEPLQFGEPERRNYHPKEEDKTVADFSVAPVPDFSFLDENTREKDTDSDKTHDTSTGDKDMSLESFGRGDKILSREDPHGKQDFSFIDPSEESADTEKTDNSAVFDSEPMMPDFNELDESDDIDLLSSVAQTSAEPAPEDVSPLEDEKEAVPFAFTRFGENNNNVYDLVPVPGGSIIEEKNGLFSISPNLVYTGIVQDPAFKKLVDSVLH
jgi:hypothetical protein